MRRGEYYHVVPRYAGGSPAVVSKILAIRVAKEEQQAYQRTLTGVYGEDAKQAAEREGLSGVVYSSQEIGRSMRVTDLILGRVVEIDLHKWPRTEKYWGAALALNPQSELRTAFKVIVEGT